MESLSLASISNITSTIIVVFAAAVIIAVIVGYKVSGLLVTLSILVLTSAVLNVQASKHEYQRIYDE